MTDDAWQFHHRDWLLQRGCKPNDSVLIAPGKEWYREHEGEFIPGTRYIVPRGTKYIVTAEKPREASKRRGARGVTVQCVSGFVLSAHADDDLEMPVVPGVTYVPLYEGRMVHQFDHAAKGYATGEGRGAKWDDIEFTSKSLVPHYYVIGSPSEYPLRGAFCRVTGQTNERSMLASLVPPSSPAGNSLATVTASPGGIGIHLVWLALSCSFAFDFLLRQKISTNLNYLYLFTASDLHVSASQWGRGND